MKPGADWPVLKKSRTAIPPTPGTRVGLAIRSTRTFPAEPLTYEARMDVWVGQMDDIINTNAYNVKALASGTRMHVIQWHVTYNTPQKWWRADEGQIIQGRFFLKLQSRETIHDQRSDKWWCHLSDPQCLFCWLLMEYSLFVPVSKSTAQIQWTHTLYMKRIIYLYTPSF